MNQISNMGINDLNLKDPKEILLKVNTLDDSQDDSKLTKIFLEMVYILVSFINDKDVQIENISSFSDGLELLITLDTEPFLFDRKL